MAYTRGSADDYSRYAKLVKDSGWSWDRLQPYFRKVEDTILAPYSDILTEFVERKFHPSCGSPQYLRAVQPRRS